MSEQYVILPDAYVVGAETVTSHSLEAARDTSRISTLWQKFYADGLEDRILNQRESAELYEIYHRYDGEQYSVLIGLPVDTPDGIPEGLSGVHLKGGRYKHYTVSGEMPRAIQQAWKNIHAEYAASETKRAFTTDFEVLKRNENGDIVSADIYVAVQ